MASLFERFKKGLAKTRELLNTSLGAIFTGEKPFQQIQGELEEILIMSDIGVKTSEKLIEELKRKLKGQPQIETLKSELKNQILSILKPLEKPIQVKESLKPFVILMLGVNGTGKTTTIGKLAYRFKNQGMKVLLAGADTFRAAAFEQLQIWANRAGVEIISHKTGASPSSVCFDAIETAKAKGIDLLIIDTAGRLHTRVNLMEELKKLKRVSEKALGKKIDETLLVLDATTGQNAFEQAKIFQKEMDLSGIVLTKLDGTAKGGIIIAIADQLRIPIRLVGVGEEIEDLIDFQAEEFVKAILY